MFCRNELSFDKHALCSFSCESRNYDVLKDPFWGSEVELAPPEKSDGSTWAIVLPAKIADRVYRSETDLSGTFDKEAIGKLVKQEGTVSTTCKAGSYIALFVAVGLAIAAICYGSRHHSLSTTAKILIITAASTAGTSGASACWMRKRAQEAKKRIEVYQLLTNAVFVRAKIELGSC